MVANLDLILSVVVEEPQVRSLLVVLVMAVLLPVMTGFGAMRDELTAEDSARPGNLAGGLRALVRQAQQVRRVPRQNRHLQRPENGYDWYDVFADCDYVSNFVLDVTVLMVAQPLRGCWVGYTF